MAKQNKNSFAIPVAIIFAGLLVAGAVFVSRDSSTEKKEDKTENTVESVNVQADEDSFRHVLGSADAPIKIVEFSDTECPFCKNFHSTMHQAIDEYGETGQVAWVYRHFPIDQLHPKARKEAEATECATELGGNEKFWAYLDRLFEITPSNNRLDLSQLPEIAEYVGLDRPQFEACLSSGKYEDVVQEDFDAAVESGGRGTPYSVILVNGVQKDTINGAQKYPVVVQKLQALLNQ